MKIFNVFSLLALNMMEQAHVKGFRLGEGENQIVSSEEFEDIIENMISRTVSEVEEINLMENFA